MSFIISIIYNSYHQKSMDDLEKKLCVHTLTNVWSFESFVYFFQECQPLIDGIERVCLAVVTAFYGLPLNQGRYNLNRFLREWMGTL